MGATSLNARKSRAPTKKKRRGTRMASLWAMTRLSKPSPSKELWIMLSTLSQKPSSAVFVFFSSFDSGSKPADLYVKATGLAYFDLFWGWRKHPVVVYFNVFVFFGGVLTRVLGHSHFFSSESHFMIPVESACNTWGFQNLLVMVFIGWIIPAYESFHPHLDQETEGSAVQDQIL